MKSYVAGMGTGLDLKGNAYVRVLLLFMAL